MIRSATSHTNLKDGQKAGHEVGERIRAGLGGEAPDAVIVFSSSRFDFAKLLPAIVASSGAKVLVGSSSAGEFTSHAYDEGSVSAVGLRSDHMRFRGAIGRGLRTDRSSAVQEITASFEGLRSHEFPSRAALVLTDALAGHADDFVEKLTLATGGSYQLFGGGAGDDANFTRTHVFLNEEAVPDAAVALEILSERPIGIGVRHSWEPATPAFRVTECDRMRLISLNNVPAVEVFQEFAESSGQTFHPKDPIPFFLHNTLGIATPAGYRLRVPLAVNSDGLDPVRRGRGHGQSRPYHEPDRRISDGRDPERIAANRKPGTRGRFILRLRGDAVGNGSVLSGLLVERCLDDGDFFVA